MTRGARFVVLLLLVATGVSAAAMLVLYLAVGQEPRVSAHSTLVLRPSGDLPEVLPDVAFGAGDALTMRAYLERYPQGQGRPPDCRHPAASRARSIRPSGPRSRSCGRP